MNRLISQSILASQYASDPGRAPAGIPGAHHIVHLCTLSVTAFVFTEFAEKFTGFNK